MDDRCLPIISNTCSVDQNLQITNPTDLWVLLIMTITDWKMLKPDFYPASCFFLFFFPVAVVVNVEKFAFFLSNICASHWVRIQNEVDIKWTRNRHHTEMYWTRNICRGAEEKTEKRYASFLFLISLLFLLLFFFFINSGPFSERNNKGYFISLKGNRREQFFLLRFADTTRLDTK